MGVNTSILNNDNNISNSTINAINNNFNNINVSGNSEKVINPGSSNKIILKEEGKGEAWRVGILCKKDCYYVILEILKCLERMGYEWKLVSSSYKIKCRKKNEELTSNVKSLNILIQIFAVSF